MRAAVLVVVLLAPACSPPTPLALAVGVSCAPDTDALRQRCTVTLTDRRTARRVEGATVTLEADMPSMPLAHSVRPVRAVPGPEPGTYHGTLELAMTGRWVIAVRVAGPLRDQVTHTIDVEHR